LIGRGKSQFRRKSDGGAEASVGLVEAEVEPVVGRTAAFLVVPPENAATTFSMVTLSIRTLSIKTPSTITLRQET
jgi:hypothetical protein